MADKNLRRTLETVKLKTNRKKILWVFSAVVALGALTVFGFIAGPHLWVGLKSGLAHFKMPNIVSEYKEAFESVQAKVDQFKNSEMQNEKLRLENANLRLQLETFRFDCQAKQASMHTRELGSKLIQMTGTPMGRILESIKYRPPTHLLPPQLYTLGVTYFKAREDEKAAVIFSLLTDLKENDAFKTPRDFLVTGIAWYRLDHMELADSYFEKILQSKETPETLEFYAQARLWRALVAHQMKKQLKAQYWLLDLVDHHPHAEETAWVNQVNKEVDRVPATLHHNMH